MKYQWIMTVKNGLTEQTLSGDTVVDPGTTRSEVYDGIYQRALEEARLGKGVVLFFSLEPDELS